MFFLNRQLKFALVLLLSLDGIFLVFQEHSHKKNMKMPIKDPMILLYPAGVKVNVHYKLTRPHYKYHLHLSQIFQLQIQLTVNHKM
ncbi:unnamed protein product [Larinioides sclopetarius]|uniref:Uncharacterized protein n=1 Tax=Larinioides sclopetarius TaxID=280406 RepID=A0AAV2B2F9_9ARAC